jgi:hypothetical protein
MTHLLVAQYFFPSMLLDFRGSSYSIIATMSIAGDVKFGW